MRYRTELISKNRSVIYAFAALWIAFFHSSFTFESAFLTKIKNWGCCGVDIFLLVSGISLYFSMRKNGSSILSFYRRRLIRVLLPALIVSVLWFGYTDLFGKGDVLLFFMNLSGLTLFTKGTKAVWFVTAIVIDYLLYPFLYRFFEKTKFSAWAFLALLAASFILNAALKASVPGIYENSEILWRRLPVFVTGCFMGKAVYDKKTLPVNGWVITLATLALTLISFYLPYRDIGHLRYVFLPLAVGWTLLLSAAGQWKVLEKVCGFLSPVCLELYLLHEKALTLLTKTGIGSTAVNLLGFAIALCGAFALKWAEDRILRRSKKAK